MTDGLRWIDILVVDDTNDTHLAYRAALTSPGQRVVSAYSGDEALRLLAEREFAVILLDVNMPGMCGHETAARIRACKKSRHTPIIFITAFADEVQASEGYALGAVDYILSPVVPGVLRAKVNVFVELCRMRDELACSHGLLEQRVAERTEELAKTADRLRLEVAERRRAEDQLNVLVGELTHRVKNLLAVLQSVSMRTLIDSRDIPECRRILLGRLHALAHAHELLTEAYWKGAALGDIVDAEVACFSDRVQASGPHLLLTGSAVQTFALVVHELATNAAKYGALSRESGSIAISWWLSEDDRESFLEFLWKEQGGPAVAPPGRRGFGLTLISTMGSAYTAVPALNFAEDGLVCRMRLPLSVIMARPECGHPAADMRVAS